MNKKNIKFNNNIILMNGASIKLQSTKRIFNYHLNNIIYKNILDNKNNLTFLTETKESKASAFYKKYRMYLDQ